MILSDIPQVRSRDAFRPIARKQKDLMDYNDSYTKMAKPMKTLQLHYSMIQFSMIQEIDIQAIARSVCYFYAHELYFL